MAIGKKAVTPAQPEPSLVQALEKKAGVLQNASIAYDNAAAELASQAASAKAAAAEANAHATAVDEALTILENAGVTI